MFRRHILGMRNVAQFDSGHPDSSHRESRMCSDTEITSNYFRFDNHCDDPLTDPKGTALSHQPGATRAHQAKGTCEAFTNLS